MPKTSTPKKPRFRSEAEEAEWYHTPAGREHAKKVVQRAIKKGKIVVEQPISQREAMDLAKRTGARIILRKGTKSGSSDPAYLQKLMEEARGAMTQAISLRLPLGDIEAAKALAAKRGIGYQTVLKELIHEGVRRAS